MISSYIVYFVVMSFVGYIYETIAMVLWSGKWESRGFLYGPIIPIYGFGCFIGLLVFDNLVVEYTPLIVFLAGFFGSIILEYPTSVILEKLFHAYWWDYSIAPLNINGRISLFSSIGFGIGALIIVYIINPNVWPIILNLNETLVSVLSYVFIALISIDTTLTVSMLSNFNEKVNAVNNYINTHLDDAIDSANPKGRSIKGAIIHTKESIIDTGVDKAVSRMSVISHMAVARIKKFKDTPEGIKNRIRDKIINIREKDER